MLSEVFRLIKLSAGVSFRINIFLLEGGKRRRRRVEGEQRAEENRRGWSVKVVRGGEKRVHI